MIGYDMLLYQCVDTPQVGFFARIKIIFGWPLNNEILDVSHKIRCLY